MSRGHGRLDSRLEQRERAALTEAMLYSGEVVVFQIFLGKK